MNPVSGPVARAALLVAVEGVALVLLGLLFGLRGLLDRPESLLGTELGALLVVGSGVLVVLLARALAARRRWARSPAVVVQLLALLTGLSLAQGRAWVPALLVAGLGAAVLSQLALPQARQAFEPGPDAT